ncbi:MAG: hypothetical protein NTW48_11420, partial [Chloroflexi bacterium]|nr:hypothetical protein [Chloroflexota bacterium]
HRPDGMWRISVINLTTGAVIIDDMAVGDTQPSVHIAGDRAVIDWRLPDGTWHISVINLTTGAVIMDN